MKEGVRQFGFSGFESLSILTPIAALFLAGFTVLQLNYLVERVKSSLIEAVVAHASTEYTNELSNFERALTRQNQPSILAADSNPLFALSTFNNSLSQAVPRYPRTLHPGSNQLWSAARSYRVLVSTPKEPINFRAPL